MIDNYDVKQLVYFFLLMMKVKFYKHYCKIPTVIIEGFLVIDKLPAKPELESF
jgi:hypothetical protein